MVTTVRYEGFLISSLDLEDQMDRIRRIADRRDRGVVIESYLKTSPGSQCGIDKITKEEHMNRVDLIEFVHPRGRGPYASVGLQFFIFSYPKAEAEPSMRFVFKKWEDQDVYKEAEFDAYSSSEEMACRAAYEEAFAVANRMGDSKIRGSQETAERESVSQLELVNKVSQLYRSLNQLERKYNECFEKMRQRLMGPCLGLGA